MSRRLPLAGAGTLAPIDAFVGHCARTGFTPSQAAAWADELMALASPWHFPAGAGRPSWLAWHRHFSRRVRAACTPGLWAAYQAAWKGPLSHRLFVEPGLAIGDEPGFARATWPFLALHEDAGGWYRRRRGEWGEPDVGGWSALASRLQARQALPSLLRVSFPGCPWPRMWEATGLRALRWGWVDAHDGVLLDRLPGTLVAIQDALAAPFGWKGPLLGLARTTGLVLATGEHLHGRGQVTRDADGGGQTLALDDWSVLAHEWLHTLDLSLARGSGVGTGWATMALAEDAPARRPGPAHAAALDAWWVQVVRVQVGPLPPSVASEVRSELSMWPSRWSQALGQIPGAAGRIAEEQVLAAAPQWSEAASARRWRLWLDEWLPDSPVSLRDRIARAAAAEIAWGLDGHPPTDDRPLWVRFLSTALPDAVGVGAPAHADSAAYLSHPVEIMARSFEVAFTREGDPVWGAPRSPAGMVWPLPAEVRHQREGWEECMAEIRPWWASFWRARAPAIARPAAR